MTGSEGTNKGSPIHLFNIHAYSPICSLSIYLFDIQVQNRTGGFWDIFTIKLKFPPHIKDYIAEREWYPNQKLKRQKDGSIQLSFDSDINMILIGWIRGFGPDVEVLEPKELREQILMDLQRSGHQYNRQ